MESGQQLLFIYGTLLENSNDFGAFLARNSRPYAEGRFPGLLYDAGEYPGAISKPGSDAYVYGRVVEILDPDRTLGVVDEYEGFGDNQPQPNEFIRVLIDAETDRGKVIAWVYLYNLSTTDMPLLASGRYKKIP